MKKLFVVLLLILAGGVNAQGDMYFQGTTLVVPRIGLEVPNVPIGLSVENAWKLVNGQKTYISLPRGAEHNRVIRFNHNAFTRGENPWSEEIEAVPEGPERGLLLI
jgi:hypothetical protein